MIKLLTGSIFLLTLVCCNNGDSAGKKDGSDTLRSKTETTMNNSLSDKDKSDGWQLLFDGQTTKGWHKYGGGAPGSAWKIADNAMYFDTSSKVNGKMDGGDIVTDDEFENFYLALEWKIAKNGNSGIMFYVYDDSVKYKKPYETGPEMQVLDNDGHADGKIIKHRAGDLYDLISCSKETVKAVGEWNLAEIKCINGKLDFYLNSENIVSTTLWDDNWKKMVAGSKFKQWQDFATYKKGKICLQDHGNAVSFRNIRIKRF